MSLIRNNITGGIALGCGTVALFLSARAFYLFLSTLYIMLTLPIEIWDNRFLFLSILFVWCSTALLYICFLWSAKSIHGGIQLLRKNGGKP